MNNPQPTGLICETAHINIIATSHSLKPQPLQPRVLPLMFLAVKEAPLILELPGTRGCTSCIS